MFVSQGSWREVDSILNKIAATSSTSEKKAIIYSGAETCPFFIEIVSLALDPYKTFKIQDRISPSKMDTSSEFLGESILEDLESFTKKPALTKAEKMNFAEKVSLQNISVIAIVNRLLGKDLRCGAGVKLFQAAHEAFKNLPLHQPMKGIDDLDKFLKYSQGTENICWSYKLDGTRTWAIVDGDSVTYLSSNGHVLSNFGVFDEELKQAAKNILEAGGVAGGRVTFDGEVICVGGDFSSHMSQFRRLHNVDQSHFRFLIFDLPSALPFDGPSILPFKSRYDILVEDSLLPLWGGRNWDGEYPLVSVVAHQSVMYHPKKILEMALDAGFEGIMLKTWAHYYENKRTNAWCKMKAIHTEDLPVISTTLGKGKYAGVLGTLVLDRNGVEVEVGSGFTDEEREEFLKNPPKMVEIKYQEALPSGSVRFPVFVRVREDKE